VIAKARAWFPTTLIKIGHKKGVIDILIKRTSVFIVHAHGMSRIMMEILPIQLHCSFPWVKSTLQLNENKVKKYGFVL
jgi:hypothetical protein